jgi:hypothetical protein
MKPRRRSGRQSPRLRTEEAERSAGLFAYVDPVGMDAFHKSHIGSDLGSLIQISYDPGDVIVDRYKPSMTYNMREIQLLSCIVLGSAHYNPDPGFKRWEYSAGWDQTDVGVHFPTGVVV